MRFNDLITGCFFLLLGLGVILMSMDFNTPAGQRFGPGLFPIVTATMMALAGAGLMVKGWRARQAQRWIVLEGWWREPRRVFQGASVFASLIFYLLLSEELGFLIVATTILWGLISLLWGRVGMGFVIAVVAAFVTHFFFVELLRVPLPWGVVPYFKLL